MILFDRPKPTVGCSASGRRRRITIRNLWLLEILSKSQVISFFTEPIAS
jgi:hypothetical protein